MEKICGIYRIENTINKHCYIGSSKDIDKRILYHTSALDDNKHYNPHLQRAFNKYGFHNFVYDILIICDPDMLIFYEQRCIDFMHPEYNVSKIAGVPELTKDICHKISVANMGNQHLLGYIHSNESRRMISAANMGNQHLLGYRYSEESKYKQSKSQKARRLREKIIAEDVLWECT